MRGLCNRVSQSVISFWTFTSTNVRIRPRFSGDFWTAFVSWLLLVVFVWYIDLIDDLDDKAIITLLCSALLLLALFLEPSEDAGQRRQASWMWRFWTAFSLFALLVGISDKWNLHALGISVTIIGVSSPLLAVCLYLSLKKRLLGFALAPSIITAMLHAVTFPPRDRFYGMLIYLFGILVLSIPWAVVGYFLLDFTEKWRRHPIKGPGMECLTMIILFAPLIWLVISATRAITSDDIWLALSLTVAGVLISSIVSTPFRKLLLALGNLQPPCACEHKDDG